MVWVIVMLPARLNGDYNDYGLLKQELECSAAQDAN